MKLTYHPIKVNSPGTLSVLKKQTSVSSRLHLRDNNSLAAKADTLYRLAKMQFSID